MPESTSGSVSRPDTPPVVARAESSTKDEANRWPHTVAFVVFLDAWCCRADTASTPRSRPRLHGQSRRLVPTHSRSRSGWATPRPKARGWRRADPEERSDAYEVQDLGHSRTSDDVFSTRFHTTMIGRSGTGDQRPQVVFLATLMQREIEAEPLRDHPRSRMHEGDRVAVAVAPGNVVKATPFQSRRNSGFPRRAPHHRMLYVVLSPSPATPRALS